MSGNLPRQRLTTATVMSALAIVVLDAGMANVALPTIAMAFAETPARSMLVVTAYQLALLVGLLPFAQVADRIGYRRLFLTGVLLFAGSAVLSAMAPTLSLLAATRALQGLGGAAILSIGIALLRTALGVERLPSAIAWSALVVAISSSLGPAAGALLLSLAGWRWLFVATLPLGLFVLVTARALPAVRATRASLDLIAITLYAAAVGGFVVAIELARSAAWAALGAGLGSVATASLLYARERSNTSPLVPFDLLALRLVRKSVLASMLLFTGQSAGLLALPFHLQVSLGRSVASAGLLIALWPLAVAATSRAANRLADRFSSEAACAAGGMVLSAGLAATALLPPSAGFAPLAVTTMVCGIGFGLFQVPNNRTMFMSAPVDRSAAAGGLQGTARLAGQTAGALLVTFVLSSAPLTFAPQLVFALASLVTIAAALVSWPRLPASQLGA